ncbi:glycosyltransferase family 9 protein [Achromobacter sp. Marseille-Q0513]|uniref:glycosyltransferase family 9 protein n=1 Tax=Achromobacter sp. Marseille-Q0513 TaxID=2829161 RepID=UPI0032C475CE
MTAPRASTRGRAGGLAEEYYTALRGRVGHARAADATPRGARGGDGGRARGLLLPDSLSSALVFRLAGLPSAGYRDDGRSLLLRWPVDKPDASLHAVESWHYLTRAALTRWGPPAGPAPPAPPLDLPLPPAHARAAPEALAAPLPAAQRFVLIAPTATGLHKGKIKVWPGFDTLTRGLQNQGHTVVMCPPPAETDEARRNAPTAQLLPPLSLGAFAALTARSALVICNDSGVSHVAAAASARQLTLFGVTRPGRTGPWSPRAVCVGAEDAWPPEDEVEQQARRLLDGQQ